MSRAHGEYHELVAHMMASILTRAFKVSTDMNVQAPYLLFGTVGKNCQDLPDRRQCYGTS